MHFITFHHERWPLNEPLFFGAAAAGGQVQRGAWPESASGEVLAALLPGDENAGAGLLLARAGGAVCINHQAVLGGLHALRAGDQIEVAGLVLRVEAGDRAQTGVWGEAQPSQTRCPVCRAAFRPGVTVAWCQHCQTPHHLDCLRARAGRCGVFGCLFVNSCAAAAPGEEADGQVG